MDEVIALASVPLRARDVGPTVCAPPTTGGDPALLLDVDVQELTRSIPFVTNDGATRAIEISEPRSTSAPEHPMHGRRRLSERPGDPVWTLQGCFSAAKDRSFPSRAQPCGAAVWAAGAVGEPLDAFGQEPPDPLVAGGRRAPLGIGCHRDAPPLIEYPLHEQQTALHGELRPRMGHGSLLVRGLDPVEQGGSHFLNNVLRNYN
jgi:hypothetical protein